MFPKVHKRLEALKNFSDISFSKEGDNKDGQVSTGIEGALAAGQKTINFCSRVRIKYFALFFTLHLLSTYLMPGTIHLSIHMY